MVLIHHEGSAGATSAQITKLANFAYTPDGIEPVHLYGSLDTDLDPKSRAAAAEDRASILDSVNERAHRLMGSLAGVYKISAGFRASRSCGRLCRWCSV
jgi:hypothetical protein